MTPVAVPPTGTSETRSPARPSNWRETAPHRVRRDEERDPRGVLVVQPGLAAGKRGMREQAARSRARGRSGAAEAAEDDHGVDARFERRQERELGVGLVLVRRRRGAISTPAAASASSSPGVDRVAVADPAIDAHAERGGVPGAAVRGDDDRNAAIPAGPRRVERRASRHSAVGEDEPGAARNPGHGGGVSLRPEEVVHELGDAAGTRRLPRRPRSSSRVPIVDSIPIPERADRAGHAHVVGYVADVAGRRDPVGAAELLDHAQERLRMGLRRDVVVTEDPVRQELAEPELARAAPPPPRDGRP